MIVTGGMNEPVRMNEKEPRGRMFSATVGLTLFIGVAAAILAIWHFSPPPPVVIQTPPETKVVEKEKLVYVPKPVATVIPPAPIVELPRLVPAAPEPPPESPTVAKIAAAGVWDGCWRRKESPLPMFRLHQEDSSVAGTCAANWGDISPLHAVGVSGDALEFIVDDVLSRVHIRMALDGQGKAKVEQWVTDDDWLTSLERANKTVKTPQQARVVRAALQQNARKFRKPVEIGVFTRESN